MPTSTMNRREFFRVDCRIDCLLHYDDAPIPALCVNLSGGGMRIWGSKRLLPNTRVRLQLQLATETLDLVGNVISSKRTDRDYRELFATSLVFTPAQTGTPSIEPMLTTKLCGYVLQFERMLIARQCAHATASPA